MWRNNAPKKHYIVTYAVSTVTVDNAMPCLGPRQKIYLSYCFRNRRA